MTIVPNLKKQNELSTKLYFISNGCKERSPWEKKALNSNYDYTCIVYILVLLHPVIILGLRFALFTHISEKKNTQFKNMCP